MLHALSFTVLMYHSMSGTWTAAPHTFIIGNCGRTASNSGSVKPQCQYRLTTNVNFCLIVRTCWFGNTSTVPNLRLWELVKRKGFPFTNMISIDNVMSWWICMMSGGTPWMCECTVVSGQCTVFPFNAPRFGPNMSSAAWMSALWIGQFFIWWIAVSINSHDLGCIMMFWKCLAATPC